MERIRILLLIFFILVSCSSRQENERSLEKRVKIMMKSLDIPSDENKTLLYLLDASCSSCIADVIEFLTIYEKCNTTMQCRIFVDENHRYVFDYYLDEFNDILSGLPIGVKIIETPEAYPFGYDNKGYDLWIVDNKGSLGMTRAGARSSGSMSGRSTTR